MNLIAKETLFVSLLSSFDGWRIASAGLTSFPLDTEAIVGQTVRLNCSTSDIYDVLWEYTPVGSSSYEYVFFSGRIIKPYNERFKIEGNSSAGEYHLVISNVQPNDAGLYGCVDRAGHGERREAELIILEFRPACNSQGEVVAENPCNIAEEQVKVRCRVKYSGNKSPIIACGIKNNFTFTTGNPNEVINNNASYVLTLDVNPMKIKESTLHCRTVLSETVSNDFSIKVLYISMTSLNRTLRCPELLNCSVDSSSPCRYKWFHRHHNETITVDDEVIWANQSGSYECEAECSIRDQQCKISPVKALYLEGCQNLTQSQTADGFQSVRTIILATMLSLTVPVVIVIVIAMIYRTNKHRRSNGVRKDDQCRSNIDSQEEAKGENVVQFSTPDYNMIAEDTTSASPRSSNSLSWSDDSNAIQKPLLK